MIQRMPDKTFAKIWAVLVVLMVVAGVIGLRGTWQGWFAAVTLLAIGVVEWIAVDRKTGLRDTLSEITTWVNRKLSKHKKPLVGWNTLIAIQALALGRLIYVVAVFFGGPDIKLYAATFAAFFAFGQHHHWLDPEGNG